MKVKHGFFKLLAVLTLLCSSIAIVGCGGGGGGGGSSNPMAPDSTDSSTSGSLKAVVIKLPALGTTPSLRASGTGRGSYSNVTLCGTLFAYDRLTDDNKFECYKGTIKAEAISNASRMSYRIISENNRPVETTFSPDVVKKFSETAGFVIDVHKNPAPNESLRFGLATFDGKISNLNVDNVLKDINDIFTRLAKLETTPQTESNSASPFVFIPLEDGTYAITQAHNEAAYEVTALVIPSKYKNKDVTSIGVCSDNFFNDDEQLVFAGNNSLTSVEIPETVKRADNDSFIFCRNLKSITINSKTIETGDSYYGGLFRGCINVTSITLGPKFSGFTSAGAHGIGDFFGNFPKRSSITVGEGNTKYKVVSNCLIDIASKTLVAGCSNSQIPTDGSVTIIGVNAFKSCTSLKSITIPDCITKIESGAFNTNYAVAYSAVAGMCLEQEASQLTSITLGKGITSLSFSSESYPELATIEVSAENPKFSSKGNCLTDIASKTLVLGCSNSQIPTDGSVTIIGRYAFCGRKNLAEITIPDNVEKIEGGAFSGTGLTTVTLGSGLKSIGYSAFSGCEKLTEITIPNSVETIDERAFSGCKGLTKVELGSGLKRIVQETFSGCKNLATINFAGTKAQWNNVRKNYWASGVKAKVVKCSDGDVDI